ncbi:xylulose kinase [Pseudarthrobacter sulfonivorans]|uniref:Xylulose kinase n=1 Tax=Pseudarthrobacter sulfonivorans TaxID=121292 RepID=A0A0U3FMF8_9MICC|nr:xylulokinase [Pseudarthrobacter sulfonivorans]ALV40039.1 xylulose kinase [Pseudarthrobacter sulfonivorans]
MKNAPLVAGVDSSTQSCKVQLRHAETGFLMGAGTAPHSPTYPPLSEQNPAEWWGAFTTAFRQALAAAGASPDQVSAISVAGQCHGLVPLDETNTIIRPAKLWNDTTSTPELMTLRERIGDENFVRSVGSLPTAAFTISKIAWLAEHEPANFQKLRRILLPHDYLTFRLTGRYVTDRSEASGTGYFDAAANRYLPEFLNRIADREWEDMLPKVLGPDEPAGQVSPEAMTELGLKGRILVGAGGGDQHAAALGLGVQSGDVVYSFGTSGVVSTVHPTPVYDLSGLVNGVADMTNAFMPLVCTLNAAKVTDTFARILGATRGEMAELALAAPATDGPSLAAFLDGERTPNRPAATGILAGITTATTREDIARAAFEGVVFGLYRGQQHLERSGVDVSGRVLAVGGGARSVAYTQLLSDITRRPVLVPTEDEATARGAAVQAAAIASQRKVAQVRDDWAPPAATVAEPRPGSREEAFAAYCRVADVAELDGKT